MRSAATPMNSDGGGLLCHVLPAEMARSRNYRQHSIRCRESFYAIGPIWRPRSTTRNWWPKGAVGQRLLHQILSRKEFQSPFNKRFVMLENASVSGVVIDDEFGIRKATRQVD